MRKFLAVSTIVLGLGGCVATTGQVVDMVRSVQDYARLTCRFLPSVASVTSIIATLAGGGAAVDVIRVAGDAICRVVDNLPTEARVNITGGGVASQNLTAQGFGTSRIIGRVNGVALTGNFVR